RCSFDHLVGAGEQRWRDGVSCSILGVSALMTSSNLLDCKTGRTVLVSPRFPIVHPSGGLNVVQVAKSPCRMAFSLPVRAAPPADSERHTSPRVNTSALVLSKRGLE